MKKPHIVVRLILFNSPRKDENENWVAFYGGMPAHLIYDNLKAAVDTVYSGKALQFNRRFLTTANHYLFEPVACTPVSGCEKGQVENQMAIFVNGCSRPKGDF